MNNALAMRASQKQRVFRSPTKMSATLRLILIVFLSALLVACGRTTDLNIEVEWFAAPAAERQTLIIRSGERQPLIIKRVVLNGEFTVDKSMIGFQVEKFRPVKLTIGEAASYAVDYSKRILYADIETDRGTCRYEFNKVESL